MATGKTIASGFCSDGLGEEEELLHACISICKQNVTHDCATAIAIAMLNKYIKPIPYPDLGMVRKIHRMYIECTECIANVDTLNMLNVFDVVNCLNGNE